MKLLREFVDFSQIDNYLTEGKSGTKNVLLKGILGQAEVKNKTDVLSFKYNGKRTL